LDTLDWNDPAGVLGSINAALQSAVEAAAQFGEDQNMLGRVQSAAGVQRDTLERSLGNMVDADMAKESARVQSLQIKHCAGERLMKRYRLRCGLDGWTVYGIWTDQPVRLQTGNGTGMECETAETLANALNWRSRQGDRKLFQ
jgi:hypothetical protein